VYVHCAPAIPGSARFAARMVQVRSLSFASRDRSARRDARVRTGPSRRRGSPRMG
jgi:hypothetical protein